MPQAIGFFDSGVGGVNILLLAEQMLPNETFVYIADAKYAPYGDKSPEFILERAEKITRFLLKQNVKAIVIACNTATSHAIVSLRSKFKVPIIGMEPAIKPALLHSTTKHIAVLATHQTLQSDKFNQLSSKLDGTVLRIPAHGLVALIESGNINNQVIIDYLKQIIKPILTQPIDAIVLGCTHYYLISPTLRSLVEGKIKIYEATDSVINRLKSVLEESNLATTTPANLTQPTQYFTNGNHAVFRNIFNINPQILNFEE